jgi:hypothetical protein
MGGKRHETGESKGGREGGREERGRKGGRTNVRGEEGGEGLVAHFDEEGYPVFVFALPLCAAGGDGVGDGESLDEGGREGGREEMRDEKLVPSSLNIRVIPPSLPPSLADLKLVFQSIQGLGRLVLGVALVDGHVHVMATIGKEGQRLHVSREIGHRGGKE